MTVPNIIFTDRILGHFLQWEINFNQSLFWSIAHRKFGDTSTFPFSNIRRALPVPQCPSMSCRTVSRFLWGGFRSLLPVGNYVANNLQNFISLKFGRWVLHSVQFG